MKLYKNFKLYKNQVKIIEEVEDGFKSNSKVLLNATCGSGKTIMALTLIKKWIDSGKRVAISTYSKVEIRMQWVKKILEYNIIDMSKVQVICQKKDIDSLIRKGIPAITNGNVSKNKPVTIFIPQSVSKEDMGMFDYIVIDEAHEYLDVNGGVLKNIIASHSKKRTKILGLTGTGFELLNGYFNNCHPVVYDMPTALKDSVISDCNIVAEYFDIKLNNKSYKGEDLNSHGRKIVKKISSSIKLESVLKKSFGKTLVVAPRGENIAESLNAFINMKFGGSVIKTMNSKDPVAVDNEFRFNKNIKFMVVVDMCGTGWDFPELNNVIDLTFTKNPKVIIQRLSRLVRKHANKKPTYYYCCDRNKSELEVRYYLGRSLELTTKEGILNYDGCVLVRKPKKKSEKETTIKIGKISDYYNIIEAYSKGNKTIFRKSLSSIIPSRNKWRNALIIIGYAWSRGNDVNVVINKMKGMNYVDCLKLLEKEYPNEWKRVNGKKRPNDFEVWDVA